MTGSSLILGAPQWTAWAGSLMAVASLLILWSYVRARTGGSVRLACAALKLIAVGSLAFILLEPLLSGERPRRGANAFAVLVDNSQSMLIRDDSDAKSRGDWARERLQQGSPWRARLGQDFDVRDYAFDTHIRSVDRPDAVAFDGQGSTLGTSLGALSKRFRGLPLAGVLVFTDGNRTDLGDLDHASLPPIYPVVPPGRGTVRDVGVRDVSASQTNFESAPVVLSTDVAAPGFAGESIATAVVDESGKVLERQEAKAPADGSPLKFRFQFRPERKGVHFFRVRTGLASEEAATDPKAATREQTLANNSRLVVVDQGAGPYRVLYVGGQPNWEFKFLRRALQDDEQIRLIGLVRIARRQPKFDFQSSARDRKVSPLFDGFDHPDSDAAERADQSVLIRMGTDDEAELRDGFPKTAEELYRYHAIVIDDLEAAFFNQDQLGLLRNFVGQRGGGLLMLGGPDSFADGKYDRTPIGELLPVYLDARVDNLVLAPEESRPRQAYRLALTREGWLQPWVRTRKTEDEERKRLAGMPGFHTLSRVGRIKPGAVTLAEVEDESGKATPALVAQTFGAGHSAALLVGDLWRWGMRRPTPEESDLERSWRQTARWLVSDVPGRVEVAIRPRDGGASPAVTISARVRDKEYRSLDNARVAFKLTLPDGGTLTLSGEPDGREPGLYTSTYVTRQAGAHRVLATAADVDGSPASEREAGWAAQPAADEFARLTVDRDFLTDLARRTGGEVVEGGNLDTFVATLPSRHAPVSEPWTTPLWHHPAYFLIALVCLTAEWGLRRVNGLA